MKNSFALAALLVLCISLAYAVQTRPPDMEPPGGVGGGGGGGSTPESLLEPQTSDLFLYLDVNCFDHERQADGMDPRSVIFYMREYHDDSGGSIDPSYQEYYPVAFRDARNWDPEPNLTMPLPDHNDPIWIRYEGRNVSGNGCYAFGRAVHYEYIDGVYDDVYDTEWQRVPGYYYEVDWDGNGNNCQVLGAAWDPEYGCCGDDWIWVNNLALDYAPRPVNQRHDLEQADELCLYSNYDLGVSLGIDGEQYGMGDYSYFCRANQGHVAYDSRLLDDDDSRVRPVPGDEWWFAGSGINETDLGIWSNYEVTEQRFCNMHFDNSAGGVSFEWLTIDDAASRSQVMCEVFLGYNWTGSQCCGAPGSELSYSDPQKECDGDQVYNTLVSQHNTNYLITPQYKYEYDTLCDEYMGQATYSRNRACYDGKTLDNNTVLYFEPYNGPVMNADGTLYVCEGADNPVGFEVVSRCGTRGNMAVCTYRNNSWYALDNSHEFYSYQYLGMLTGHGLTEQELADSIHDSALPAEVPFDGQRRECCVLGSCWAGERCEANGFPYELMGGTWQEYDGTAETGKDVYKCQEGTWLQAEMLYDWYYDTEHPDYCLGADECVCTTDNCGSYSDMGCTSVPQFFVDDHICQGRTWTSRTRLLASQLMQLADNDYTLFCDQYDESINYFAPLEPIENSINSICVLNYSAGVVLGVTFNAANDPLNLDVGQVLFHDSQGFVRGILGEDIDNCDDAIVGSSTTGYGTFKRCDSGNGRVFYNNRTQMLIYAKNGLSQSQLAWDQQDDSIPNMFQAIAGHIISNAASINEHQDITNIQVFENANSFSRLYVSENQANQVFGTVETLYDPDKDDNRHFLGMHYAGVDGVSCSQITSGEQGAYCSEGGGDVFVLQRRNDLQFEHWTDLSAKLRFTD